MPPLEVSQEELRTWGQRWLAEFNPETGKAKRAKAFDRRQSVNFASFIDRSLANSLAVMLGGIPVIAAKVGALTPLHPDCVEIRNVRVIGGIRPQNFDVVYRPDGPRIAFDSKTLNDEKSVRKNWQNMINDLATEATTVHTRFPFAIVAFAVVIPRPALASQQEADIIRTLERLGTRRDVLDQSQLAEAISLIVWDPATGAIDANTPTGTSILRVEKLSATLFLQYLNRYKGLPPHNVAEVEAEEDNNGD
ncbi:MAG: hypothetical protein FJ012_07950 [Chloroflexi bacterium]|nr:hypothetical protein [Chloroflexota bacterium]